MDSKEFQKLALSFPGTESNNHFDRVAFKVTKRRIFATLLESNLTANIKLNLIDQSVFCTINRQYIYTVSNKWGLQGWTTFEIEKLNPEILFDALECGFNEVINPRKT